MPRFVVLRHERPGPSRAGHWDLMLEAGDRLRTWSVCDLPQEGRPVEVEELPDHRPMYLDYEGPISGHRGHVVRVDGGTYELIGETADELEARLDGREWRGRLRLARSAGDRQRWVLSLDEA